MKKSFLLAVVLLAFNSLFANPVDEDMARELGEKFVAANFRQKSNSLDLVYIEKTDAGKPCFYVFNVGEHGFVFVSANDYMRPVLGYSENGTFDIDNVAPGLAFMMGVYEDAVEYADENDVAADPEIISEWKSVERSGRTKADNRFETIGPLCTTKWSQSWPYNKFCPVASWDSDEHVPVGCVATAMAQIMRYWAHPIQGTGTESYTPWCFDCYGFSYPQQTANFGETVYDWANMPDKIYDDSPVEQIDAVATLSYHCGVAVKMKYEHHDGDGSTARGEDIPKAVTTHFNYAQCEFFDMFQSYDEWMDKLKESIIRRIPVYYQGCSASGCHAFVCDGMDPNELFHFNYGWGGKNDGFFAPDAIQYSNYGVGAIFDMIPDYVYNNTAMSPSDFTVVPFGNDELSATLSWTNPTKNLDGSDISHIDKIIVMRLDEIIYEDSDVVPGSTSVFVDDEVPFYSYFDYTVYAVIDGVYGNFSTVKNVFFGPSCDWKLIVKTSDSEGMFDTYINVFDHNNVKYVTLSSDSSDTTTFDIPVPFGNVCFGWETTEPEPHLYSINIVIRDSDDEVVYEYTGNYAGLPSGGIFFKANNTCGGEIDCEVPTNLEYTIENGNFVLTWDSPDNPKYGYNIYRDDKLIGMSKETTFTDENVPYGGHCYSVSAFCENGITENSDEICDVAVDGCDPPYDLWCELSSNNRAKLYWEAPLYDSVSYYYVMRKANADDEWKRIKILSPDENEYTDNIPIGAGKCYFYRVIAKYTEPECYSPPAKAKYNDEYFVMVCNSTDVADNTIQNVEIYPNPAKDVVKVSTVNSQRSTVKVYNYWGILVEEIELDAEEFELDVSDYNPGIYFFNINGKTVKVTIEN